MRKAGAYETLWESLPCWVQRLAGLWGSGAGTVWAGMGRSRYFLTAIGVDASRRAVFLHPVQTTSGLISRKSAT